MCTPIAALALAGSAVAAGVNYAGQQATLQAQNNANNEWLAYQQNASAQALAADTAARQKASAAEQTTLNAVGPQSMGQAQAAAQANLTNQMLAAGPASADANVKALGAGDQSNPQVSTDMAQRVTQAARAAQGRIAALAGASSYGGGYGDMGDAATQAIAGGNEAINLQSDIRGGIAKTLGIAQNVQPVHYQMGSDIAGTLASSLANIAGTAFGSSLRKTG